MNLRTVRTLWSREVPRSMEDIGLRIRSGEETPTLGREVDGGFREEESQRVHTWSGRWTSHLSHPQRGAWRRKKVQEKMLTETVDE